MTERKFTDEDLIKALECCTNTLECRNCPLIDEDNCTYRNINYVLDLINRQRAEIEKWQLAYDCADSALRELSVTRSEAIKEFAERLKEELRLSTGNNGGFVPSMIDRLVKEMTEGKQ